MRKAKAIYSDLAIARESGVIPCILAENQKQRSGKGLWWRSRKGPGMPGLEDVGMGRSENTGFQVPS